MQFRPPFRPSPPDQSWQQQNYPAQQPVNPQWREQSYPTQFQQPAVIQPKPPEKKSRRRFWLVIAAVACLLVLAIAIASFSAYIASARHLQTSGVSTKVTSQTERPAFSSTPSGASTAAPANLQHIKPTHAAPVLNGQISDFIGAYGKPSTTNGKDSMWLLNSDGSLALDARDTGRGVVGYISISIPDSWSGQKARAYCLTFAPHNYTLEKTSLSANSGELYVYNSPAGRFALHVSPGYPLYCSMNTVQNP